MPQFNEVLETNPLISLIIGALFGMVLSLIPMGVFEWCKRPKLFISEPKIVEKELKKSNGKTIKGNHFYAHLRGKVGWLSRRLGREVAHDCRGKIYFYKLRGESVFPNGLPLSWVNSLYQTRSTYDENQYSNVAPGTAKGFNIIHQSEDGKLITILSNEPNRRTLDPDFYYVKVEIESNTKPTKGFFELLYLDKVEKSEILIIKNRRKKRRVNRLINKINITERAVN